MPQYSTKQDFFSYNIFVLLRVYENTKIKGLDSGKIISLPKSHTRTKVIRGDRAMKSGKHQ